MSYEYCVNCNDLTGNAGRDEDSIFLIHDNKEIGPLCESCRDEIKEKQS